MPQPEIRSFTETDSPDWTKLGHTKMPSAGAEGGETASSGCESEDALGAAGGWDTGP